MAENVVESVQRLIQDVIAPDVRELKVRVASLEKRMDERFNSMKEQIDSNFKAILSAIGESRAQSELATVRELSELRERVAVLEAQRH